jgi:hypothetical protein
VPGQFDRIDIAILDAAIGAGAEEFRQRVMHDQGAHLVEKGRGMNDRRPIAS